MREAQRHWIKAYAWDQLQIALDTEPDEIIADRLGEKWIEDLREAIINSQPPDGDHSHEHKEGA